MRDGDEWLHRGLNHVLGMIVGCEDLLGASERRIDIALVAKDLARLGVSLRRVRAFIEAEGWVPRRLADRDDLKAVFAPRPEQLSLL